MEYKLRIHLVPVGFEIDRIVEPLVKYKADKAYLITHSGNDEATPFLNVIERKLKKVSIDFSKIYCNRNDIYDFLKVFKNLINEEKGNLIYINVSSGGKVATIAGVMAAMMFRESNISIEPYYVEPNIYNSKPKQGKKLVPISEGIKDISTFFTFRTPLPDNDLVSVMKFIDSKGEARKKEIINFIFNQKEILENKKYRIIKPDAHEDKSIESSNKSMWVNRNFLDKLQFQWKFIEIDGKGKNSLVKLNKNGDDIVKFL